MAPPVALHDGLTMEGRWRTVSLLNSLHPTQDVLQVEKNVFLQSGGDWNLYESGIYRVCSVINYKREEVEQWTPEQLVSEEPRVTAVEPAPKPQNARPSLPTVECQIKCGRCKSTHVSVEQKQTRGADESMTVFVQCENCGLRWKM